MEQNFRQYNGMVLLVTIMNLKIHMAKFSLSTWFDVATARNHSVWIGHNIATKGKHAYFHENTAQCPIYLFWDSKYSYI